jgi:hypothetical protein
VLRLHLGYDVDASLKKIIKVLSGGTRRGKAAANGEAKPARKPRTTRS